MLPSSTRRRWLALFFAVTVLGVCWLFYTAISLLLDSDEELPPLTPTPAEDLSNASGSHACPALHPVDHGLVNTGRPALVLYVVTSLADKQARQIEVDNVRFFKEHAILPPKTPTALFSAVDFAVLTVNLARPAPTSGHGIRECSRDGNVRVFEAPSGPCDLCAEARLIDALGGPEHVARTYEFVSLLNSGVRGPFFSEVEPAPGNKSPVTWIDHLALGGEKVYTGAIMTGTDGIAENNRPFLYSFALSFPSTLLTALFPVLKAGCVEAQLPVLWQEYTRSYTVNLHEMDQLSTAAVQGMIERALQNSNESVPKSAPRGQRTQEEREFDRQVAQGDAHWRKSTTKVDRALRWWGGERRPPAPRKNRCVMRSEMQLLKSALDARLPPEADSSDPGSTLLRRPKLNSAQLSQLSPALSGYLHEGHFFAHSRQHKRTLVNLGHAAVIMYRSVPDAVKYGLFLVAPCRVLFPKFGGDGWRKGLFFDSVIDEVQALSLAQPPRFHPPSRVILTHALRCRNPQPFNDTRF